MPNELIAAGLEALGGGENDQNNSYEGNLKSILAED
jgi:hypothetical protein